MAKRSKEKGNTFERKVAADLLSAAGPGFRRADCYRTPMSGGHKYAGQGDLVISESLQKILPFVVECKHQKAFRTSHLFHQTEIVRQYHAQAIAEMLVDPFGRAPLLVMRGKDNETYASVLIGTLFSRGYLLDGRDIFPILHYRCEDKHWVAMPWDTFLGLVREWAENFEAEEALPRLKKLMTEPSVFETDISSAFGTDKSLRRA